MRCVSCAAVMRCVLPVGTGSTQKGGGGLNPFNMSSAAKEVEGNGKHVKTRFSDVLGCDEAKEELQEVVKFLKSPAQFQKLGGKMPKGVLLTVRIHCACACAIL
jgi:ATP-dependent Zn protease